MRSFIKSYNGQFKEEALQSLQVQRNEVIDYLAKYKNSILKLDKIQRFIVLDKPVRDLSFHNDFEVKNIIKDLGLIKYTPKVFVAHSDFFRLMGSFQEHAKFLYPSRTIWSIYELYSLSVIKEKIALDLDINPADMARRLNRQRNTKNSSLILGEAVNQIKILIEKAKTEMPEIKYKIKDNTPFTSIMHQVLYSHKNDLYHLYMIIMNFNKELDLLGFNEPDFKEEFYDLLVFFLREKELLNDTEESRANYPTLRQFKIKRVERLILS